MFLLTEIMSSKKEEAKEWVIGNYSLGWKTLKHELFLKEKPSEKELLEKWN